ncbi:MAG: tetratricopeptide repeat protein, partial [Gammaproteobacteria bacterium]|nr:tetratricopeptide repeat protein [Gammaproteobacteria bacterium]
MALVIGWGVLAGAAWGVVREFQAARARSAEDRQTLERALRRAEDDAALHHRLGQWEQFSLPDGSLERALAHFRRAAELNPYESRYALDLADLLLDQGHPAAAAAALQRALRADPRTPRTLWRAGNFWLRAGQPERAVPYLRQVLSAEPGLAPLVIQAAHRTLGDARVVLRDVLPAEPRVLLAYVRHLVAANQAEDAARVWQALVRLERPFEVRPALAYVDFLIRTGQVDEAEKAWSDLKRLELVPPHTVLQPEGERLHNPRLQDPILNGGFGWRVL